ncbi:MAG: LysR family transcriptional regulator [Solirubrobacterales bacterium]|nr:LysR family transcriptional regulator [Solirubrobacterales bacterium]
MRIALRQGSAQEALTLLSQGAVDVALTSLPPPPGTTAHVLTTEPLVIVGTADDTLLAARAAVPIAALRERTLILAERGTALREVVLQACQAEGFSPVPLLEAADPAAVLALARAGLGLAVVPASWIAAEDAGALAVAHPVPAGGRAPELCTVLLTGPGALSPAAELLHEHLLQVLTING